MAVKLKAYANGFVLRLGSISTTGALIGAENTVKKGPPVKFVTPDGKAVNKVYIAADEALDEHPTIFKEDELEKGIVATDTDDIVLVGKDNLAEAKKSSLPKNVLNLTIHDKDEVDRQVLGGKNTTYVLLPDENDPVNVQWYDLLREVIRKSGKAFVGVCNLQNHEGLFRVGLWRNNITIQKQLYPTQVKDIPVPEGSTVKAATVKKAISVISSHEVPFDVDTYTDSQADAVAALTAAAESGTLDVAVASLGGSAPVTEIDMDAALDAFMA